MEPAPVFHMSTQLQRHWLGQCQLPRARSSAVRILVPMCFMLTLSTLSVSNPSLGRDQLPCPLLPLPKALHLQAREPDHSVNGTIACFHLNRCSGHGHCEIKRNVCICNKPPEGKGIFVSPPSSDCSRWGDDAFTDVSRTLVRVVVPPPFFALTLFSLYQCAFKTLKRNPLHSRVFDLAWLLVSFICLFRTVHFLVFPLSSIHPTSQISGQIVFAIFFSLFLSLLSLVLLCWIRVQTLAHYACFPPPTSSVSTLHLPSESSSSPSAVSTASMDHRRVYRIYSALGYCFLFANVVMYLVIILLFSLNLATSLFGILFTFMFFLVILAVVSICGYLILHREYSKLLHALVARPRSPSTPWPKSPAVPNIASEDMLHLVMRPEIMAMRQKSTRLAAYVFIASFSCIIGRALLQQADAPNGVSDPDTWLWLQLIGRCCDFAILYTIVCFLSKVPYYSETVLPLSLRNPTAAAAAQRDNQGFQHPIHLPPATLVIKSVDPFRSGCATPTSGPFASRSRGMGARSGASGQGMPEDDLVNAFERHYHLVHGKSIEGESSIGVFAAGHGQTRCAHFSQDASVVQGAESCQSPSTALPSVIGAVDEPNGPTVGPSPGAIERQRTELLARVLELQRSTRAFEEQRAEPHGARPSSMVICVDGPSVPSRVRTPMPMPAEEDVVDVSRAIGW